ncbi:RabGAP/TBC [Atractiella rhizophila]|nr:RabGAP/TBC [Atractiella rhizophila]
MLIFSSSCHSDEPQFQQGEPWKVALGAARKEWEELRGRLEGRKEEGGDVQRNNPLSLERGNTWEVWFQDLGLRKEIQLDVERTFPDMEYFRDPQVQERLVDLLFIFSKLNPQLGYRQGMHELLAPLLWIVELESLDPTEASTSSPIPSSSTPPLSPTNENPPSDELMYTVLSRKYVVHDTWFLFNALMRQGKDWFDHSESIPLPMSPTSTTMTSIKSAGDKVHLVQPIMAKCLRIQNELLRKVDEELWDKLRREGIEPQIWGMRWIRCLFGREFSMPAVLELWDGIFAEDPSLRLVEQICVAMLLRIRDAILEADASTIFTLLLRYPAPPDGDFRLSLLVTQAVFLRDNLSASGGETVRAQNVEVGAVSGRDIVASVPQRRQRPTAAGHAKKQSFVAGVGTWNGEGGLGDIAKGVMERAEQFSVGGRALFGEIKKNYQAHGASGSLSIPRSPLFNAFGSPTSPDGSPARSNENKALSRALNNCLEVFERELATSSKQDVLQALKTVRHISEVLAGSTDANDSLLRKTTSDGSGFGRPRFGESSRSSSETGSSSAQRMGMSRSAVLEKPSNSDSVLPKRPPSASPNPPPWTRIQFPDSRSPSTPVPRSYQTQTSEAAANDTIESRLAPRKESPTAFDPLGVGPLG